MNKMFFYGPLAHVPLLETVLGRRLDRARIREADLPGFATFRGDGQAGPVLATQTGSSAKGLLLAGVSKQDVARLDFYNTGFGSHLQSVTVNTKNGPQQADVYFPKQDPGRGADWQLAQWQAQRGEISVLAATEAMGYFGQITAVDLAQRFGAIRRRAASYLRGQAETGRASTHSRDDVQVLDKRTPYSNFYTVQEYDLRHRRFSGEISAPMGRAVFVAYDAAIVLPYDPVLDCVLLVEQLRIGAYARGADQPWLLEPVAGHVDVGETPMQAAMRETVEEAGVHLTSLIPICHAFPSPGDSTEFFHIYLGLCDLSDAGGKVLGVAQENEDIHSHILSFDELMQFVNAGGAGEAGSNVLPLITAAYWLAINRDRLRKDA